ncbi:hypothetical protein SCAB_36021 [Streptomyces scabiei 87.22]|uniref:Uncharacterized protein n=1 Tax=Streptomyces scabiei (strain 87.22) TaxID=680198 RepID=C9YUV7_STRSW|nr:hypothetical protein SCAB_36021 [Streptomyces scabiei 87.22]
MAVIVLAVTVTAITSQPSRHSRHVAVAIVTTFDVTIGFATIGFATAVSSMTIFGTAVSRTVVVLVSAVTSVRAPAPAPTVGTSVDDSGPRGPRMHVRYLPQPRARTSAPR